MDLSPAFFQLQLTFAGHVARVTQLRWDETLLDYTTFYLSLELGRSFDPKHPVWQTFVKGLTQAEDPAVWTTQCYRQRRKDFTADFYGCFYYSYLSEEQAIRIHFVNRQMGDESALSKALRSERMLELASMFHSIQATHLEARAVRGGSWLYNLDAYRRLFPPEYVRYLPETDDEFQFMALWGQFLTRAGQLRQPETSAFLAGLREQTTLAGLKRCFPYQVLRPECAIDYFYEFYASRHM